MTPTVSIIIASYNYGRFVGGALDSVLSQTFSDWEAIVVDDGSTDNTQEVIRPYLRDARIRCCHTDHLGAASARNQAIRLSRGRLMAVLDADDLWLPTKLERQVALFQRDPELGIVYARRFKAREDGRILGIDNQKLHRGHVLRALFLNNFVCFSSVVIRRQALHEVGLLDARCDLTEDWDLLLRIGQRYRFDYVDEPLVIYRTRDISSRAEKNYLIILQIIGRFLDEYGGRQLIEPAIIRRVYAETYLHFGQCYAARSRGTALRWYLAALARSPGYFEAWRELVKLCLPKTVLQALRRALVRPDDNEQLAAAVADSTSAVAPGQQGLRGPPQ